MPVKRIIVSILILTMACAIQGFISAGSYAGQQPAAESQGPILGKWAFDGKDDKGVVWTGTLTIKELDTTLFNTGEYYSMCILEAESKDSSNTVDAPCVWDRVNREVSFGTGRSAYTAILSADGKNMTQGRWTESEKDFRTRKVTLIKAGEWSAKYTGP
jgi:hypothetical protein